MKELIRVMLRKDMSQTIPQSNRNDMRYCGDLPRERSGGELQTHLRPSDNNNKKKRFSAQGSSGFSLTCLSVGEYAGVISLECVFKYSLSKALEHHLLTFFDRERVTVEMMVNK